MIRFSRFLGTLLLLFSLFACSNQNTQSQEGAAAPYQDVDVAAFKELIAQNPDAVILDVRTPQEFASGNIEGAKLMDVNDPAFEAKLESLPKNQKYLVYCRSGQRSVTACNIMADKGFEDLTNLLGGYMAWEEK
jgi:rhodanese-related sulfurtransferase